MKLLIISEHPANKKHGTGAQLLRTFAGSGTDFSLVHLNNYMGSSECDEPFYSLHAASFGWGEKWPFKGRGVLGKIDNTITQIRNPYWERNVNKVLSKHNFDVAYVIVSREVYAQEAWTLLQQIDCPFVLHLMDLHHEEGMQADAMPGFSSLVRNASTVLAISEAMLTEVNKLRPRHAMIVRIGQEPYGVTASITSNVSPVMPSRIVAVGSVVATHRFGMPLLCEAVEQMQRQSPCDVEICYAGAQFDSIPMPYRDKIKNYGQLTDQSAYQQFLASGHLAFLPGPLVLDDMGKFSFPSRTSDFMMSGLPILACVTEKSATALILDKLVPNGVRYGRSESEIIAGYKDFMSSSERWEQASRYVRQFAEENFNMSTIRTQILSHLTSAWKEGKPKCVAQ